MFGELSNSNDFEDWMRCVAKDEDARNRAFPRKQLEDYLVVFQIGIK